MTSRGILVAVAFAVTMVAGLPAEGSPVALVAPNTVPVALTGQRQAVIVATVVDDQGRPIEGAAVRLIRCEGAGGASVGGGGAGGVPALSRSLTSVNTEENCEDRPKTSDEEGRASFGSVRVGSTTVDLTSTRYDYVLYAEKSGYLPVRRLVRPHPARNDIELVLVPGPSSKVAELMEQAQSQADQGEIAAAEETMVELTGLLAAAFEDRGGRPPEILVSVARYLAYLRVESGSPRAAESLADVLELDPFDTYALRAAGLIAVRSGDFATARDHFGTYLLFDTQNADALALMGSLLIETGETDAAVDRLESSLALDPTVAWTYRSLGLAKRAAGDNAAAIVNLEHYLEISGTPPDAAQIRTIIEELRR